MDAFDHQRRYPLATATLLLTMLVQGARGRSSGNSDTLVSGPAAGGGDVQRGVIDFS